MTDPFATATVLAADVAARRIPAIELVEAHLARIGRDNPALNAIVALDEPGARARAREADAALARGESWGPLHGVPVTCRCSRWTGSAAVRSTAGR